MKLCIVANGNFFSTYGGGQVYVKNLINELIRQKEILDVELSVVSFDNEFTETPQRKGYQGIDFFEVNPKGNLISLLSSIRPDIVHAHGQKAEVTAACRQLSIPCIVTAHHGGILCPAGTLLNHKDQICHTKACHKACLPCYLKTIRTGICWYPFMKLIPTERYLRLGRFLEGKRFIPFITPIGQAALSIQGRFDQWQQIRDNATLIIAPSQAIADSMILNGANPEKIKIIPHGIPISQVKEKPIANGQKSIAFYYVGRITRVKGIHVMLEAFSRINNAQIELHIIGGVGTKSERRYMNHLQGKYRRDKRIIWHGKVAAEEVPALVNQYDVLIHPTICMEIFGLDIAEAIAQAKFVIATRCGGAEMQIHDEQEGLLVDPNDVDALKDAMIRCIDSPVAGKRSVISLKEHILALVELFYNIIK